MKKLLLILTAMAIAFFPVFSVSLAESAEAAPEPERFFSGDYMYIIAEDGTAEIVGCFDRFSKELIVPNTLNGIRVTAISNIFDEPGDNKNTCYPGSKQYIRVVLPEGLIRIGLRAFENWTSLAGVEIPETVTVIEDGAFCGCYSLTELIIPDGVTRLDGSMFEFCDSMTRITIPLEVTELPENPFYSCSELSEFIISPDHPCFEVIDGVLFSKPDKRLIHYPRTFREEHYTIPDGTLGIGELAFSDCGFLTDVSIPESMTVIGDGAFSQCIALTGISIPEGVTRIGRSAFSQCWFLENVSIPESVTSIEPNAFYKCDRMTATVVSGSYAESFCQENGIPYISQ